MSSSKILAPRSLLPPFRPTLGTHSPAHHIAESRHVTDMAAVFTVCLCTANSGLGALLFHERRIIIDESLDPDENAFTESRFRFTLAHEVGHWRLQRHLYLRQPAQSSSFEEPAPSAVV